ncbi:hypothetical protein ACFRAR_37485 [Kitasatospora sp. NPDC056651]|uniref:hypothetical protein n=1 Tax=Kitasatospora sp. NPDC056651 TaxID=3345892 RepID=UPI0036745996
MKFSKRAGAMLLAVGAGVLASPGAASAAAPIAPEQVGALEDALATQQVPADIPLAPLGSRLTAGIPTSLLMPPVPGPTSSADGALLPEQIVPQLGTGKVGPSANAELPVPLLDQSADVGTVLLDAPASPLHAKTPGLTLGKPLALAEDGAGQLAGGRLKVDEIDPRLVTGAVQVIPGAKASLGDEEHSRISLTDTAEALTGTTTGMTAGVVRQTGLTDLTQL